MTTTRTGREQLPQLDAGIEVPETVPEFLEVTRPPTRRRRRIVAGLILAAIAVAAIVVTVWQQPAEFVYGQGDWDGDWKDVVVEEATATDEFVENIVRNRPTAPADEFVENIVRNRPTASTGDWKDTLVD